MDRCCVPVFRTSNQALLPLATMALDGERIEYMVRQPREIGPAAVFRSDMPFIDAGIAAEVLVREEDAAKARDLLADLSGAPFPPPAPEPSTSIDVRDLKTGMTVGQVTPAQAQFLVDQLEEEDAAETRYFIDALTIEMLEREGAEPALIETLRRALGSQNGVEIHVPYPGIPR
jgi:hypothetical protein